MHTCSFQRNFLPLIVDGKRWMINFNANGSKASNYLVQYRKSYLNRKPTIMKNQNMIRETRKIVNQMTIMMTTRMTIMIISRMTIMMTSRMTSTMMSMTLLIIIIKIMMMNIYRFINMYSIHDMCLASKASIL
ncbi:uncharacterized protein LOC143371162 [Andrena cerasifolii]|uniref:uncharacterized protein LOC143371162 n=1 Tax=Andrena cerasifolii TaxID=2819439 RepID=UPI0040383410